MSYLVIARKYRPQFFNEVIGQQHVTRTLENAINLQKVHHAYIFTGPRGVGKTSVSRILAKALNCETGITATPCGKCHNCIEIEKGNSLDVKEIDGASNRGIDEIRDLRDDIKFSPAACRKKIYIIDEVHMLTNQAFNALLKTLEEPPEHAVFIFATTEINEVPATILSRCQRHDFKRIPIETLTDSLAGICNNENVKIDRESLTIIARAGDGSVRDSQSVLDQVIAYCGLNIESEIAAEALGIPSLKLYFDYLDLVLKKDSAGLIKYIETLSNQGTHFISFTKGMLEFFRNLLVIKSTNEPKLVPYISENTQKLIAYSPDFNETDLLYFLDILSKGINTLKHSSIQRVDFEIILLKILHYEPVSRLEDILEKLSLFEGDEELKTEKLLDEFKKVAVRNETPEKDRLREKENAELKASPEQNYKTEKKIPESNDINHEDQKSIEKPLQTNPKPVDNIKITDSPTDTNRNKDSVNKTPEINKNSQPTIKIQNNHIQKDNIQVKKSQEIGSIELELIKKKWLVLANKISADIPSLGKMWNYSLPKKIHNNTLEIIFSDKHKTFMNLCKSRIKEISTIAKSIFKTENLSLELKEGIISEDERIIKIEEKKIKSPEQIKKELLTKSPQLQFLFEDPLSCKIIK